MPSLNSDPKTLECEAALVAALMVSDLNRGEVFQTIQAEMFTDEAYKTIYRAIVAMHLASKPIGLYEVLVHLRGEGMESMVGGADALANLLNNCPDDFGAIRYAGQLVEFWRTRKLVNALDSIRISLLAPKCSDDRMNVSEVMAKISCALADKEGGKVIIDGKDEAFSAIEARPRKQDKPSIGIQKLDATMNLFHPGELSIVAGRPGGGKSSFMRQVLWRASLSAPILVFTLEVTPHSLLQQLACEAAGIPYETWRDGIPNDADDLAIATALGEFEGRQIKIYAKAQVSALNVSLAVAQLKASGQMPKLVIIDYLGLVNHGKAERYDIAVGQTTRALKMLALEQGLPIMLLCQMNRKSDDRGNATECDRPRLADLRDSGNIEQDADNVLFLWKRDRDVQDIPVQRRILTIAKHRNGRIGDIDVMFDMPKGRFYGVDA